MFEVTNQELKEIIMGILFTNGDGIELIEFTEKFGRELEEIKALVEEMKKEQNTKQNAIQIITYANKVQLSTNEKYAEQISAVLNPIREKALTKAAMQTLGIIAYKQPVTRLEIENIRGVNPDYAIQVLLKNKMIYVVGRKDVVGKPLLFGTTEEFLKRFDLENLESLPDYDELLEKIALIRAENEVEMSESLYKEHEITDDEIPDYLQAQKMTKEEMEARKEQDEELKVRLKSIDGVIRKAKLKPEQIEENKEAQTEENVSDEELEKMFNQAMGDKKD